GLPDLVANNRVVIEAEVVDIQSYWNADRSFILSSVSVRQIGMAKGSGELVTTFTILGGQVGATTAIILGNPEFRVGGRYIIFLNPETMPGGEKRLTVRDLAQGVFTVTGDVAVSQAADLELFPDDEGATEPVGRRVGLSRRQLMDDI